MVVKNSRSVNRCGAIIFNESSDKVLMVLNKMSHEKGENKWGFPKGHRKHNEKVVDCARREVSEETGICLPKEFFKKRIFIHNSLYFIIFLRQDYDNFDIKDKNEIAKVEWQSLKQIKLLNKNRDVRKFISKNKNQENFDLCVNYEPDYTTQDVIKTVINNLVITI